MCDRCRDPTENGTMIRSVPAVMVICTVGFSGLRCTRCQTGYFLPKNPLDCEAPSTNRSRCAGPLGLNPV